MMKRRKRESETTSKAPDAITMFIQRHHDGDIIREYMEVTDKLTTADAMFLSELTSTTELFPVKLSGEVIQHLLRITERQTVQQMLASLEAFVTQEWSPKLPISSIDQPLVTAHISIALLETLTAESEEDLPHKIPSKSVQMQMEYGEILLGEEKRKLYQQAISIINNLVKCNILHLNVFRRLFSKLDIKSLHVLWMFHCSRIVPVTTFLLNNAENHDVIDIFIKNMVFLLCNSPEKYTKLVIASDEYLKIDPCATSQSSDSDTGHVNKTQNNLIQEMSKDLLSALILAAGVPGSCKDIPQTAERTSFFHDILDKILKQTLEELLTKSEVSPVLFLPLLERVPAMTPTTLQHMAQRVLQHIIVQSPPVSSEMAVSLQGEWTYKQVPPHVTAFMHTILKQLGTKLSFDIIRSFLGKENMNWKFLLITVSNLLHCNEETDALLKAQVDAFLTQAFSTQAEDCLAAALLLARQACHEATPLFPSYVSWFSTTFSSGRTTTEKESFCFLVKFLTSIVPMEPASCLRVHINKVPRPPSNCMVYLKDYIDLARTRLSDLKESAEFGLFGNNVTIEEDIERAISHFAQTGEIIQTLLNASLIRKQYFEKEFLSKLLVRKALTEPQDIRSKFIKKLYEAGKIPRSKYQQYENLCNDHTGGGPSTNTLNDRKVVSDPEEELKDSLDSLVQCIQTSDSNDSSDETVLSAEFKQSLRKVVGCLSRATSHQTGVSKPFDAVSLTTEEQEEYKLITLLLKYFDECLSSCSTKTNLVWPRYYVRILQPFHSLTKNLYQKLIAWSTNEDKLKSAAVFAYCTETSPVPFSTIINRNTQTEVTLAGHISEEFTLNEAHSMEHCLRFCSAYLQYAEARAMVAKDGQITGVPAAMLRRYLYLHERWQHSDDSHISMLWALNEQSSLWAPLVAKSKMSAREWLNQEADIDYNKDFLSCRHMYMSCQVSNLIELEGWNQLATDIMYVTCGQFAKGCSITSTLADVYQHCEQISNPRNHEGSCKIGEYVFEKFTRREWYSSKVTHLFFVEWFDVIKGIIICYV